ncbi:hypothetical protein [Flavobacterium sufflavum]|uniref:hypothetical protein n=1 Tax=Flavobacterium sufflavum TaxID=1921138 RepID=UPI0013E8E913|nr:hypothetical protein [Flavobacterium sufflavum]
MFHQINEIIDINLELIFQSKSQSLKFSEFKDKNGKKLGKIMELFQLMENENLIRIESNKCILTDFGKDIAKNGGWFKHLEKKKEKEKIKTVETKKIKHTQKKEKKAKPFFIDKNSFSIFTKHFKSLIKKKKI